MQVLDVVGIEAVNGGAVSQDAQYGAAVGTAVAFVAGAIGVGVVAPAAVALIGIMATASIVSSGIAIVVALD
jgi:hypothetical protein